MDAREPSRRAPAPRLGDQRDAVLEAARRYASGPLARRLGAQGRPVSVEPAEHGKRSLVYFVQAEGAPPAVLRAVPSWCEAWALAYNLRWLRAQGLRVPALLVADRSLLTRLRCGFWPVVEERVAGRHLDELERPAEGLRAVARLLAAFHRVVRRRWGRPWLPRWGSYRRYLLRRMERRARSLDAVLERAWAAPLAAWCRQAAATAPLAPPYALTHSRVYPANFVVTPEGEAVALDLLECRFGAFGLDLAWALEQLCGQAPGARAAFREAYFAERPEACRAAYDGARAFFEAEYHLARASIYARRLPRRMHVPQARDQKLAALRRHATRLQELTDIELTIRAAE